VAVEQRGERIGRQQCAALPREEDAAFLEGLADGGDAQDQRGLVEIGRGRAIGGEGGIDRIDLAAGKTSAPAAKPASSWRAVISTSSPAAPSRSSRRVAAGRGMTGRGVTGGGAALMPQR